MPPARRILLIRHGETEWNRIHRFQGRSDVPLNASGRTQALALAEVIRHERLAAIYSSPLARALETARIIQAFHPRVPLRMDEDLQEMDLGEFEGMEADRLTEEHSAFLKAWLEDPARVRMPGGETLEEVQIRALRAVHRAAARGAPDTTLLISGHNFLNLTFLCHVLSIPLSQFRKLRQGTAALNVILKDGAHLQAKVVNDRSHLNRTASTHASARDLSDPRQVDMTSSESDDG